MCSAHTSNAHLSHRFKEYSRYHTESTDRTRGQRSSRRTDVGFALSTLSVAHSDFVGIGGDRMCVIVGTWFLGIDVSLQHVARSTGAFSNSSVTICNHATLTFQNGSTATSAPELLKHSKMTFANSTRPARPARPTRSTPTQSPSSTVLIRLSSSALRVYFYHLLLISGRRGEDVSNACQHRTISYSRFFLSVTSTLSSRSKSSPYGKPGFVCNAH